MVLEKRLQACIQTPSKQNCWCLIVDGMRQKCDGRFGFMDIFACEGVSGDGPVTSNVVLESNTLQLLLKKENEECIGRMGDTKTWDRFLFKKNNRDATDHMPHDALEKELKFLIKNLKPRTREIEKALVI